MSFRLHSSLIICKTCKDFCEISKLLLVWHSQYHQYVASHKYPPRIEDTLEAYSSTELEQWTLTRRSADLSWQHHNATPTRIRRIKSESIAHAIEDFLILPGGRWLLLGDQKGTVIYYDLDLPDMPERFLIKPEDPHFQQRIRHFRVSIDEREPRLTFILAFSGVYTLLEKCKLFPRVNVLSYMLLIRLTRSTTNTVMAG